jgi:hypothetical protein
MKKIIAVFVFVLSSFSHVFTQDLEVAVDPVFKAGEKLQYKLKYGIFTAAEANLRVENSPIKFNGKPALHIIADGKTAGTFDVFYKVRNRYESYIDPVTLKPYLYTEDRHESDYKHTDKVSFDHENNKITANKGVFAFKGNVFDFPSAYYFARNLDVSKMKVGQKFNIQYFLEDGVQTLGITFAGREQVKCSMGKFNCLKFNPTIIPGRIFKKNSKLYLWITDDQNRIPVKAKVEVVVGSLTMDLTGASGLKYPLNPIK